MGDLDYKLDSLSGAPNIGKGLGYTTRSMVRTIEGQDGCRVLEADAYAEKIDYGLSKHYRPGSFTG